MRIIAKKMFMSDSYKEFNLEDKKLETIGNYFEIARPILNDSKYICIEKLTISLPYKHAVKSVTFFAHDSDFNYENTNLANIFGEVEVDNI